jgi:hypothetical protein
MVALLLALVSAGFARDASATDSGVTVRAFRTEATPRVDAVFGDPISLRVSIDDFVRTHESMNGARDRFSTAVHRTLAALAPARPTAARPRGARVTARTAGCPPNAEARYRKAHEEGVEFLGHGRKLQGLYREIRRADELGDSAGLTPDYRIKARRVTEIYGSLLRDYREMRVAFYDQLWAELRFAGCRTTGFSPGAPAAEGTEPAPDPLDAAAWDLEDPEAPGGQTLKDVEARATAARVPDLSMQAAQAVWIDVDNSKCARSSRLSIDGLLLGTIAGGKRTSVRARAGTRELCLLPEQDGRVCGEPGTLRKTYLYEGLTLTVHCAK